MQPAEAPLAYDTRRLIAPKAWCNQKLDAARMGVAQAEFFWNMGPDLNSWAAEAIIQPAA